MFYKTYTGSVGKGGISIYPFLDLNNNGVYDKGEKMLKINSVRIFGGKVLFSDKDSIIRMPDLNPFVYYNVEFDDHSLENIAWRFKNKIFSVLIDPNQFKRVDLPIIAVGEVSGMVYVKEKNNIEGIGRITVKYYDKNTNQPVAESLSESDGYINYMGLMPGEYIASVDSGQVSRLNYTVEPQQIPFTIKPTEEGDLIGGINFTLTPVNIEPEAPVSHPVIEKEIYLIGTVTDKESGTTVNAIIELIDIKPDTILTKTESQTADGSYKMKLPGKNKYMVYLRANGYLSDMKRIEISDTSTASIYRLECSTYEGRGWKEVCSEKHLF